MMLIWGGERAPEVNQAIASFVANHIPGCERGWDNFTTLGSLTPIGSLRASSSTITRRRPG